MDYVAQPCGPDEWCRTGLWTGYGSMDLLQLAMPHLLHAHICSMPLLSPPSPSWSVTCAAHSMAHAAHGAYAAGPGLCGVHPRLAKGGRGVLHVAQILKSIYRPRPCMQE